MATGKEQILQAFHFRHACKEFDPAKKIPAEDFDFILETGRLSPSSFGFEPWKFAVIQNPELRERLREVSWGAQRSLPTASHFVLMLARTRRDLEHDSAYISYMMNEVHHMPEEIVTRLRNTYRNFLENEYRLVENDRLFFEWACRQTYIALANMMTSAALIGIDSCPVEGFDRDKVEAILNEQGILEGGRFGLACMVGFGYRVNEPRPKTRQSKDRVVRWVE